MVEEENIAKYIIEQNLTKSFFCLYLISRKKTGEGEII
ncbi:hypothetical protein CHY_2119 [Carboxydothermus hydrogenoformans Z-2901]|uniref:Uncharacterized protein n=1 Tax=Carboxydothermus hydrogenoformans (strain ATCC BAA-161 / DSM 6008 / Z-2901) TaxID=246194 RepID=Q3AAA1_CARHZ|nr:hypothetical protein CHY_2119 [Carboxydothermus hydrogenoformans Z-2901]